MNTTDKHIWFLAKRYGWGWGLPCAWQGWVAYALFVILVSLAAVVFLPHHDFGAWTASLLTLCFALLITCLIKGERPRWRWGKD
jgi:hypothetical protein